MEKQFQNYCSTTLSLRYDNNDAYSDEWSYSGGFVLKSFERIKFHALLSHDFSPPPLNFRYIDAPERNLKGNRDLKAEIGDTLRLFFEISPSDNFLIEVGGYIQKMEDGIILTTNIDGVFFYKNINDHTIKEKNMVIYFIIKEHN